MILASASVRRNELLCRMGLDFTVIPSNASEAAAGMPPRELVEHNALLKVRDVCAKLTNADKGALIIGADTIVVKDNRILGKPTNGEDAFRMLRFLSGSWHSVFTAITICEAGTGKTICKTSETAVCFKKLSDDEIKSYIASGEPLDKAGAYGIQGLGAVLIEKVEGDYGTVVGMSPAVLADLLAAFGFDVLSKNKTIAKNRHIEL